MPKRTISATDDEELILQEPVSKHQKEMPEIFSISTATSKTLQIVNKCRQHLGFDPTLQGQLGIPQIVVIGLQSAGKSAFLNSILGHKLFDSKAGMCTRHPLVIELHPVSEIEWIEMSKDNSDAPFKATLKVPNGMGIAWSIIDLRKLINDGTQHILKGIKVSDAELHVSICGPNLPELSMVDLPGIILSGEDTQTIKTIGDITVNYVKNPKSLVVLTHSGTEDHSTNPMLSQIIPFDPQWNRTILVFTRCDMLSPLQMTKTFSDISELKKNGLFKQGIFISGGLSDEIGIQTENNFLMREDITQFCGIVGTKIISKHLVDLLDRHVRDNLQEFFEKVDDTRKKYKQELISYGRERNDLGLAHKLASNFLKGVKESFLGSANITGVAEGVVLKEYFQTTYLGQLRCAVDNIRNFNQQELNRILQNCSGIENRFTSVPREIQLTILRKQTSNLHTFIEPSIHCLNYATKLLDNSVKKHLEIHVGHYPDYSKYIYGVVRSKINILSKKYSEHIIEDIECSETFFHQGQLNVEKSPIDDLTQFFKLEIVPYLSSQIPRIIDRHVVKKLLDEFENWINNDLYENEEEIRTYLIEKDDIIKRKKYLNTICIALDQVIKELTILPEFKGRAK